MKKITLLASLTVLLVAAKPLSAQEAEKPKMLSPGQIVEQAAPEEWKAIAASDLLVMDLVADRDGNQRRVIIQLIPPPFSQGWVRNIRKMAKAKYWDGTAVIRVQDNYVVQWGDPAEGEKDRKVLPEGLEVMTESDYYSTNEQATRAFLEAHPMEDVGEIIEAAKKENFEYLIKQYEEAGQLEAVVKRHSATRRDSYSYRSAHMSGWPLAQDGYKLKSSVWPVHCYGMVGVGRGLSPNTGDGSSLYTVIGHAPRHLDRNIALVGRVIEGIEHLSSLPRGKGALGFYEDKNKQVPIASVRLASELPETEQPKFQYLDTEGESFAKYAHRRANREPPFFIKPAGGADICNIPVPVRRVKESK